MSTPNEGSAASRDFVRAMVAEDLRTGKYGGRVITRFPPEPNGYLHIGHAKSICLNFGIAEEVPGARCHLRFDDTNPETEDVKYVEAIQQDVRWLGFDWGDHLYFASDYFERLYYIAEHLIRTGHAYVDSSTEDEIREARGTVTEPGRPTKYRDRSVEENLDLFRRMRAGEFPDGAHVLRGRIDLAADNMLMRDPVLYRIRHAHHYRQGDAWCIYPLYDYAHALEDAIEGVTHSLCTLEFDNNREIYDWVVAHAPRGGAGLPEDAHPEQTEFARLALDYAITSKRKLLQLVTGGHVSGWDDPRMPTIAGLRRRGVTPEAVRAFCELIGVGKSNTRVDIAKLEYAIRDDLNHRAPRVMAVVNPLKVVITNWPEREVEHLEAPYWPHDVPKEGTRAVPFSRELFIERDDFMEDPPKGFFRLSPGAEVRLRYAYIIRCDSVIRDEAGDITEVHCTYDADTRGGGAGTRNVKGTIHWVSAAHAARCEVRLYDRLFRVADPEADEDVDFREHLNPESLTVVTNAYVEPSVADAEGGAHFQFERLGYFFTDPVDSRPGGLVFNRTVTLRDSWARMTAGADAPSDGRPDRSRAGKRSTPAAGSARTAPETRTGTQEPRAPRAERSAQLEQARVRYESEVGLPADQADVITRDDAIATWFEDATRAGATPAAAAKWITNEVPREARERAGELPVGGAELAALIRLVDEGTLSGSAAREVLTELLADGGTAEAIMDRRGLRQVNDTDALAALVSEVLAANPAKVAEYRGGRAGLLGFFVGQAMARSAGRGNPAVIRQLVEEKLSDAT